ncbi:cytidylyltransferase domain-containing protein [Chloroflexota bacterium]
MKNREKESNIIGIIPARGGSKRLPYKNIKLLNGKPLIYYTIHEAKRSKYLSRLIVSTEDSEIAEISRRYDTEVIERPAKLAQDDTPSLFVFQYIIQQLEEKGFYPDVIVILQPTSPCRGVEDIDKAIEMFMETDCDSVVSVCETEVPLQWVFRLEEGWLSPIIKDWQKVDRRQNAPETYRLNGAIYVIHRDIIVKQNNVVTGNRMQPYIMPEERSVDIDSELDFKLAELIIENRK